MHKRSVRDRASILADTIVGLAASILVSAALTAIAGNSFSFMANGVDASEMQSSVLRLRSDSQGGSGNAVAVFIPAKDIFGTSNTIAFGTAGSNGNISIGSGGHEFDTLSYPLGTVSSEAYYYSGTTGLIQYRYLYRRPTDGVAMCSATAPCTSSNVQIVREYPGCSGLNVAYFTEPNLPSIDPMAAAFAAAYPSDLKDVTVQTGYSSDVISGNRLVAYNVTCSAGGSSITEQVQLAAGNPLSTGKEPVTYTPPPIGALSVSPNPIILGYGGANGLPTSQTLTASDRNYHHDFTLNGTTVGQGATTSVDCSGIAKLTLTSEDSNPSGSTNNPPSSFPGMWMSFSASAEKVGGCTATFSTLSGLQPPDDQIKTGSTSIIVQGDLTMTSSPSPLTLCANSGCGSTPNAGTVTISLPGYSGSIALQSNCSSYISGVPSSVTLTNGTASFSVSGASATPSGTPCTITADAPSFGSTSLAQGNASITATVITAVGPLTTDPGYILFTQSSVAVADAKQIQQHWIAQQINLFLGGAKALAASTCTAFAYTADPSAGGALDVNDASIGTDSTGCFIGSSGVNVHLSQSGNTQGFLLNPQTCQGYVAYGKTTPATGSPSTLPVGLSTPPPSGVCTFTLTGQPGATPSPAPALYSGLVGAREVPTCNGGTNAGAAYVPVGGTCTFSEIGSLSGNCSINGGDTTKTETYYTAAITGGGSYGTLSFSGSLVSKTYTFTRSAAGDVGITVTRTDEEWAAGTCAVVYKNSYTSATWGYF